MRDELESMRMLETQIISILLSTAEMLLMYSLAL